MVMDRAAIRLWIKALIFYGLAVTLLMSIVYASALILGSRHPFMVMETNSMYPVLRVNDIAVVASPPKEHIYQVGDIIVYRHPWRPSDYVAHRIVAIEYSEDGIYYITKGDNNLDIDPWSVPHENVEGQVIGKIPYIGVITRWINGYTPVIRLIFIASIAVAAVAANILTVIYNERMVKTGYRDGEDNIR